MSVRLCGVAAFGFFGDVIFLSLLQACFYDLLFFFLDSVSNLAFVKTEMSLKKSLKF